MTLNLVILLGSLQNYSYSRIQRPIVVHADVLLRLDASYADQPDGNTYEFKYICNWVG